MQIPKLLLRGSFLALLSILIFVWLQNIYSDFFYDEIVYVNLSKNIYRSDFYSDFVFVRHPPLYWILLRCISIFGYGEAIMRSLSLVFSLAILIMIYLLGISYRNEQLGLLSAVILTFSTMFQQYSQAATMYSMLCFLFTLSIYAIKIEHRTLTIVSIVLTLYTSYFGFFLLFGILFDDFAASRKIRFSSLKYYLLPYIPWLGIAIVGVGFQFYRLFEKGEHSFSFTPINFIIHLSILLFIGFVYFSIKVEKTRGDTIILYSIWIFLFASAFMSNYERYVLPILPISIVLSLVGLEKCIVKYKSPVLFLMIIVGIISSEGYGIYPKNDYHLDERDMIHTQEWSKVCENLSTGTIATTNARGIIYYLDLEHDVSRNRKDYGEIFSAKNQTIIQIFYKEDLDYVIHHYNVTYFVFQKNKYNQVFIEKMFIDYQVSYSVHYNVENTIVFRKNH